MKNKPLADPSKQEFDLRLDWNPETTVGFGIFRSVPVHNGHVDTVNNMIANHKEVIIGIGSANSKDLRRVPYPVEIRQQMWRNVFGNRIKFVPLADLGFVDYTEEWYEYVLDKIRKLGLPTPTDFYSGSEVDAKWYMNYHAGYEPHCVKHDTYTTYYNRYHNRRLHIIDRSKRVVISGTDLRTSLELRDNSWKQWVPRVNHALVENNYPPQMRVPLQVDELLENDNFPNGTFIVVRGERKYQKQNNEWIEVNFSRQVREE